MMALSKSWSVNNSGSDGDGSDSNTMALASIMMVASSFLLMISIVNRGVASGGGRSGDSYGGSVVDLFAHYLKLLFEQAIGAAEFESGPLEILSIAFGVASLGMSAKAIFIEV